MTFLGRPVKPTPSAESLKAIERAARERHLGCRARLGENHQETHDAAVKLGDWLVKQEGRARAAEPLYREALRSATALHGPEHSETVEVMVKLSISLTSQKKLEESEKILMVAKKLAAAAWGPDQEMAVRVIEELGHVQLMLGKSWLGKSTLTHALKMHMDARGPNHKYTIKSKCGVAVCLLTMNQAEDAEALIGPAFRVAQQQFGDDDEVTQGVWYVLVAALNQQGKDLVTAGSSWMLPEDA